MAYDHENIDLVNLIDDINGTLWPFMKFRQRVIRRNHRSSDAETSTEQEASVVATFAGKRDA